jgi:uncharacterized membrane-anchored protein YhcB (DUF1043 family)
LTVSKNSSTITIVALVPANQKEDKMEDTKPVVQVNTLVQEYIALRDAKDEIKREAEAKMQELEGQMDEISQTLLDHFKESGIDKAGTPFGTAYRTIKSRYWTNDWDAMYTFIAENNAYELLEKRLHQSNMKQFLEENPDVQPKGLNIDNEYKIVVRRK